MAGFAVKYKDIFCHMKDDQNLSSDQREESLILYLLEKFNLEVTEDIKISLKRKLSNNFFNNYNQRYKSLPKNKKNLETFETVYDKWLQNDFHFEYVPPTNIDIEARGRPEVTYQEASERTKRRRNSALAGNISIEELCDTANKKMKLEGNKDGGKLISKLVNPEFATELMAISKKCQSLEIKKMTSAEALEMLISCNLTKSSYNEIRCRAKRCGHDLYPSYKNV